MNDDFWDEALSQQISESLTHSGVMANFDKRTQNVKAQSRRNIEWTQTETTKWHDLNYTERVEAASQVQAVVFAQLGALAHSMIEFGCGLNRSCAFVRRMAIRNQLPSSQRAILLQHLMARNDLDLQEDKALSRKEQLIDS
jgi:6-phosphofructokinase